MESFELLVIEDNRADVAIVQNLLKHPIRPNVSFKVISAPTLRDGLGALGSNKPDAILFDLRLPDGTTALENLAAICQAAPRVPVVVVSGQDDTETVLASVRQGARDYLVKGRLDAAALQTSILRVVEWSRAALPPPH